MSNNKWGRPFVNGETIRSRKKKDEDNQPIQTYSSKIFYTIQYSSMSILNILHTSMILVA